MHVYMYMNRCTYMRIRMHACTYTCIHTYTRVYMYTRIYVCAYDCMYACMHACVRVCGCMYACMCVCMYSGPVVAASRCRLSTMGRTVCVRSGGPAKPCPAGARRLPCSGRSEQTSFHHTRAHMRFRLLGSITCVDFLVKRMCFRFCWVKHVCFLGEAHVIQFFVGGEARVVQCFGPLTCGLASLLG